MKFACPKCSTRYSIADEKVPPAKTLRFPCKKCGNVIRLQRKGKKAGKPVKQAAPVALDPAATRVAPLEELNKLRTEASEVAAGDTRVTGDGAATKVASVADIQQALAARDEPAPIARDEHGANEEWYVLIAGKQKGPMTAVKIVDMLSRNEIDKRSYVWRDGMDDWKRLGTMAEFKDLAQRVGDAAWRVMAPLNEPGIPESTVAMDARQLREQLQRVRDDSAGPSGFEDEDTRQMDMSGAQAALGQQGIITAPSAVVSDLDRSTEVSPPVDLSDPAVIDALSGEPTGDRMTRPLSGEQAEELLGTMFPDNPVNTEDDLFPIAPREPEPFSEADILTPGSGEAAVTGDDPLRFDEPSAEMFSEAGGFPDATEEPVDAPIDGLSGPSDFFDDGGIPPSPEYQNAPPGESTRVFMATAGLYKRRRTHRIAAAAGILVTLLIITIVSLDIMKIVELPGMGAIYATTGILDPNPDRGIRRVEDELAKADLAPEKRASLEENRKKYEKLLLSGGDDGGGGGRESGGGGGGSKRKGSSRDGVKDTRDLGDDERDTLKDVFGDDRKTDDVIRLADPDRIETPNLPDGLSRDVIFEVFKGNARSIQLCFSESTRKGEQLAGKMEMEVTIAPDGGVTEVGIVTDHFKRTAMGTCTIRRVKSWRFPKFNGKPVTVVLPYIVAPVI